MTFSNKNAFQEFNKSVCADFRYARTLEQAKFLEAVAASSPNRLRVLKAGVGLHRAQLGHDWRQIEIAPDEYEEIPSAYKPARMLPDPRLVGEGRVNAKGIACLYLATKAETAALEVRPLIGSYISLGYFEVQRDLRIVDCSEQIMGVFARFKSGEWSAEEIDKQVWTDINAAFSAPVERADAGLTYVPTQIIAETLRLQGYDGIAYKSGYGEDGFNVALFDLLSTKLKRCGLLRVGDMTVRLDLEDNAYFPA
jgi:hypothetical protein